MTNITMTPEEEFHNVMSEIERNIGQPMVTAKFGDEWKEHAEKEYDKETVIGVAFKQGRRAILLERELINQLRKNRN